MNIINRETTIINFNANFLETHKMNNDDLSKKEILFVWANIFHNINIFFEEYKLFYIFFKNIFLTQILMIYEKNTLCIQVLKHLLKFISNSSISKQARDYRHYDLHGVLT